MFGFRGRDYFQIEEADAAVPEVNLRNEPPAAAPPAAPPPAAPPAAPPTEPPQA
jgi:hypothetical protein